MTANLTDDEDGSYTVNTTISMPNKDELIIKEYFEDDNTEYVEAYYKRV
ncbi:MAG: hypothetical protein ACI4TW_08625 [Prevotella sp.]